MKRAFVLVMNFARFCSFLARRAFFCCGSLRIRLSPDRSAKLNFGEQSSANTGLSSGGAVKLRYLQEIFPPHYPDFNILYLVSSATPEFHRELIRKAKRKGILFVLNQNGVAYPAWAGTQTERINENLRSNLKNADYIFYQSEFCKMTAEMFLGPAKCPSEVLLNCIDTNAFVPSERERSSSWQIISMGSHNDSYRILRALDAMNDLKRRGRAFRYTIAGRLTWPRAVQEVLDRIHSLDLSEQVRILPPYHQSAAAALYQQADVLLHLQYNDACPSVPMEAMACGLPIVGSHSGGLPEIVGGAGILLPVPQSFSKVYVPDPGSIAEAIQRVMDQYAELSRIARARAVLLFSKDAWQTKHSVVFHQLLGMQASAGILS